MRSQPNYCEVLLGATVVPDVVVVIVALLVVTDHIMFSWGQYKTKVKSVPFEKMSP